MKRFKFPLILLALSVILPLISSPGPEVEFASHLRFILIGEICFIVSLIWGIAVALKFLYNHLH